MSTYANMSTGFRINSLIWYNNNIVVIGIPTSRFMRRFRTEIQEATNFALAAIDLHDSSLPYPRNISHFVSHRRGDNLDAKPIKYWPSNLYKLYKVAGIR